MKKSLNQYKQDYFNYLKQIRGYSELTLKTYDDVFSEAFEMIEIEEDTQETTLNIMAYRMKIASQKSNTIAKKVSALRSFCDYLNSVDEVVRLHGDESIKVPKSLPKPLSHEHIMQAVEVLELFPKTVILTLYLLGLRISELANLHLNDIKRQSVRVFGKGKKERDIPLPSTLAVLLEHFIAVEAPLEYLFERHGKKLSISSLRYIVTKSFKSIGIKATPHQLRHSYATILLNNSARIADVSELLGHASMATTQIYTKLGNATKLDQYMKAHPLCKEIDGTK
jgi:integrase/recombinase XerC